MTPASPQPAASRRLSHVEFVYPPGERALVIALCDLLGIETQEKQDGRFLLGLIDPGSFDLSLNDNYLGGSEVLPEQWAFDRALAKSLRQEPLAAAFDQHQELLGRAPQWGMHFGIHFASIEEWESTVSRIANVEQENPVLAGRVRLCGVYRPGEPGSVTFIHQAFVWTDIIASGSLAFGQRIELSALV
jgi:hypothetical protein